MDHNTKWQARVIEAINRIGENYRNQGRDVNASAISAHDRFYEEYAETFRRKLISHLQYPQMYSRSERVKVPYEATFEWIFSPLSSASQNWSNFATFLESDQNLYWITGKPGSGKSTLMKFIKDDKRTAAHLRTWSGDKKLYLFGFYFWCSDGDEMQMTHEGLLRTLLCHALQTFPELTPLIFPRRLETFVVFGDDVMRDESWVRFYY
jgi:hypothetical protein